MKKRYILSCHLGDEPARCRAVVASQESGTSVQVDDGPLLPVNHHAVLGGRAISLRRGGRLHLVHLTGMDRQGRVQATIGGRTVQLTVMDELKAQALASLGEAAGSGTLQADIPGLVVDIPVQPGQLVHKGEPVIVVEAMKMQNELTAGVTGTVQEIPVAVGQAVNPGDTLLVIEPEAGA